MAVLRDTTYWNGVLLQMVPYRPGPGEVPSEDDVERLLRIACGAFSHLVNDPELPDDLAILVKAAKQSAKSLPLEPAALKGYLQAFRQVEIEILRRANVPEDAFYELEAEVRAILRQTPIIEDKLKSKSVDARPP